MTVFGLVRFAIGLSFFLITTASFLQSDIIDIMKSYDQWILTILNPVASGKVFLMTSKQLS